MRTFSKFLGLAVFVLLLSGLGACGETQTTASVEGLTVVFPKLGSADAAILMTGDATIVIDTGESGDGKEILSLLQQYDRDSIDLLVISHYDQDHVGGAAEILNGISVKRIIGSTYLKDSVEVSAYQAALKQNGLQEEVPAGDMVLSYCSLTLTVSPPASDAYSKDESNNASLVVSVQYGDTNMLFLGDAMAQRLKELRLTDGTYDLVKIPHHGRDPKYLKHYLASMKSGAAAIITSSTEEPEDPDLVTALQEAGMQPYLTLDGAVTVVSDGTSLTISQ